MSAKLSILPVSREEWLENRKQGIGGSEIGAICGLSPYKTPLDVWLEKKNLKEPNEETMRMRLGKSLEPVIAHEYELATGRKVTLSDKLFTHEKFPWALGTPDGFINAGGVEDDIFEAKAPGWRQAHRWGPEWTDEIPDDYLAQVIWYLGITGRRMARVAALFGNEELRKYDVPANAELFGTLLEAGAKFWHDNIEGDKQPDIDASDSARDYLASKFPKEIAPLRPATTEEAQLLAALFHVRARRKEYEANEELVANQIREKIGSGTGLEAPGVGRVTWKMTKGAAVTDLKGLVESLKLSARQIEAFTSIRPGSRRFLPTPEKG